jgi:NADH:ubiquinone oxidoreductase subunit 4 (subunit M)
MIQSSILSILIFLPIVGALVVLFLPRDRANVVRWTAFAFAALDLVLALILMRLLFRKRSPGFLPWASAMA